MPAVVSLLLLTGLVYAGTHRRSLARDLEMIENQKQHQKMEEEVFEPHEAALKAARKKIDTKYRKKLLPRKT